MGDRERRMNAIEKGGEKGRKKRVWEGRRGEMGRGKGGKVVKEG